MTINVSWGAVVQYSRPRPYAPRTNEGLLSGMHASDREDWTLRKVAAICLVIGHVLSEQNKTLPVNAIEALAREARRNLRRKHLLIRRAKDLGSRTRRSRR